MKLKTKITTTVIGILLLTIGSISILSFNQMKIVLKDQFGRNLLNIANSVSMSYLVQNYLTGKNQINDESLNNQIEAIRIKTKVEFIVVMDMKGIRYSHPTKEKIGKSFEGGDEKRVLTTGEEYVSEANGSLGPSLRVFTPIIKDGKQIGAVAIGSPVTEVYNEIYLKIDSFIPFIILGLILGVIAATLLSSNIKKAIFGLEPEEIALMLKEKEAVIESVNEGILAVDKKGRVTLFNRAAGEILGLTSEDIGRPITNLSYEHKVSEVLKLGKYFENIEMKVRPGLTIFCKYNPLKNDKDEVIGLVMNFRDLTEVKKMAEELTGIKKMTCSLRAQNHEFMNKLHAISGMIQLGEYADAVKFISSVSKTRKDISGILQGQIKNVYIAALLLSKYNKAEEARIIFEIDSSCKLDELPQYMREDELGSVIGNLIENSLDAVSTNGNGFVHFKIFKLENELKIQVNDNGPGITTEMKDKIYEIGTTTKTGQRGVGMYVVKKIIDEARGTIEFSVNNGTWWNISIPMERSISQ
ncbi:ATP-binding protein [Clostridium estertheticum]|uniref:Sensor histidine kinase n=1 Tax=Clostridium estertheticum TaxID=238834 RepID=A0AA47EIM0_9CLOT|nr:sensor histidine kinase [Clostridium estertheticum]MBU3153358.1 sensor histidine kinase [Clostridium estertheticum]WAG60765.1 sensor histidine kinase [Clostridium estertheticum]